MNDALYEMIFKRKSFHLFRGTGDLSLSDGELASIRTAWSGFTPLDPSIRTAIRIAPCLGPRGAEYCILFYSEKKDGYLQNIGYLGEQMDLYLVSENIGTLWLGLGKPDEATFDGLDYVIMIAIRKLADGSLFRKDMFKSKRDPVEKIWQGERIDGVTELVRFAPSACNSQPWFVKNDGALSVFRRFGKLGIMPKNTALYFNRIDMGIFLSFLDLCLKHRGIAFRRELFCDGGDAQPLTLNAVYHLL